MAEDAFLASQYQEAINRALVFSEALMDATEDIIWMDAMYERLKEKQKQEQREQQTD